jgi:lysophospholipase L1-like esterase
LTCPLSRLIFWVLLPVTALQGLWLKRHALRLPGATGARQGVTGQGRDFHFLAIGDSIIDGVGAGSIEASLPVQFATALAESIGRRVHWRVDGASGHAVRDLLERVDGIPDIAPVDLVLVSIGVNDVTGLSGTRHWRRSLHALLQKIRSRWPSARILFAGLPPMANFPLPPQPLRWSLGLRATTLDHIAEEVVSTCPVAMHVPTRIDPRQHGFCEDGFHPSAESCTLWARELAVLQTGSTNT